MANVVITEVFIIAKDKLRLKFDGNVSASYGFLSTDSYGLTNSTLGIETDILEVLPTDEKETDYVDLRVDKLKEENVYIVSILADKLVDFEGVTLNAQTVEFLNTKTKTDSILQNLSKLYKKNVGSNIRGIIEAIAISDADIGRATSAQIISVTVVGGSTYGTGTAGTGTYGG